MFYPLLCLLAGLIIAVQLDNSQIARRESCVQQDRESRPWRAVCQSVAAAGRAMTGNRDVYSSSSRGKARRGKRNFGTDSSYARN